MFEQTIDSQMLLLIEQLASYDFIQEQFYLAGGTSLALQLGHRYSVDLDLFSQKPFQIEPIIAWLMKNKGQILLAESDTIHSDLEGIKISFFHYPYKLIKPLIKFHNLRMADLKDIACMKLIAISQRAAKKDFYDLYEILQILTPHKLKYLLLQKYTAERINCYHILKSCFFFGDMESDLDPISLKNRNWREIKEFFLSQEKDLMGGLLS